MKITTLVPPAASAVSLEQARAFLRVDYGGEDELLSGLIDAATLQVERAGALKLMPQTLRFDFDCWPQSAFDTGALELPIRPVRAVVSVMANGVDVSGSFQMLAEATPALSPVENWPPGDQGISITMDVGFASSADIPADLTLAVRLLAADAYRHREGELDARLSDKVERMIAPWRRVGV